MSLEQRARKAANEVLMGLRGVMVNDDDPKEQKRDYVKREPTTRPSAAASYARSLGDFKIVSEVAEELGVSSSYVRKLSDERATIAPSYKAKFGKHRIRLYTEDDIQALRSHIETRHGGPEKTDG